MAKKLADILSENAGKISIALGALTGIGANVFFGEEREYVFPREYASTMIGLAFSSMYFAYLKSLAAFKNPVFRNSLKLFFKAPLWLAKQAVFEERKKYDKLVGLYEEQRGYFKSEAGIDLQIGNVFIKKGDIESCLLYTSPSPRD